MEVISFKTPGFPYFFFFSPVFDDRELWWTGGRKTSPKRNAPSAGVHAKNILRGLIIHRLEFDERLRVYVLGGVTRKLGTAEGNLCSSCPRKHLTFNFAGDELHIQTGILSPSTITPLDPRSLHIKSLSIYTYKIQIYIYSEFVTFSLRIFNNCFGVEV